jgi:hypothetical protein
MTKDFKITKKLFDDIDIDLKNELGFYFDVKNGEINQFASPYVFYFYTAYDIASNSIVLRVNGREQEWKIVTIEKNSVSVVVPNPKGKILIKDEFIPINQFDSESDCKAFVKNLAAKIRNKMIENIKKDEGAKP